MILGFNKDERITGMKFTKMQGVGNDFIIINNIEEEIPNEKFSSLAKRLCTRRMSVGADGLMIVDRATEGGDYRMHFYNADGSLGEMCGNGARCVARYGYEKGLAGEMQHIETTAGMVIGQRLDARKYKVKLNDITKMLQNLELDIEGQRIICDYAELGNPGLPHAVVIFGEGYNQLRETEENYEKAGACGDGRSLPESVRLSALNENHEEIRIRLFELGKKIRSCEIFPKGVNVNFCRIIGDNEIDELTYERGVEDFTLACGTGTASVVASLTLKGIVKGKNTKVHVPGGELFITLEDDISVGDVKCSDVSKDKSTTNAGPENENSVTISGIYLTGLTNLVAEGVICDEEVEM